MRAIGQLFGLCVLAASVHAQGMGLLGVTSATETQPILAAPAGQASEGGLRNALVELEAAIEAGRAGQPAGARARAASASFEAAVRRLDGSPAQRAAFAARLEAAWRTLRRTRERAGELEIAEVRRLHREAAAISVVTGNAGLLGPVQDLVSSPVIVPLYRGGPLRNFPSVPAQVALAVGLLPRPLLDAMNVCVLEGAQRVSPHSGAASLAAVAWYPPEPLPLRETSAADLAASRARVVTMLAEATVLLGGKTSVDRRSATFEKFDALADTFTASYDAHVSVVYRFVYGLMVAAEAEFREAVGAAWAEVSCVLPGSAVEDMVGEYRVLRARAAASSVAGQPLMEPLATRDGLPGPSASIVERAGRIRTLLCPDFDEEFWRNVQLAHKQGVLVDR